MANVSPIPSDREIIDGVCGGVITPEKAVELLRGDGDAKLYLLQKLAGGALPVAHGVRLEARLAQIAEARAEKRGRGSNAGTSRLWLKVSAKGAISLYGLQRLPVTLYVEQWERLLAIAGGDPQVRQGARRRAEAQGGRGGGVGASLVAGGRDSNAMNPLRSASAQGVSR